uniref:Uncharacterized protein n=1 Tax=Rhizophora mucronata TaxID=61149 RepID=A0A2P2Q697_RHIMU
MSMAAIVGWFLKRKQRRGVPPRETYPTLRPLPKKDSMWMLLSSV